jgi:hypothetical protein
MTSYIVAHIVFDKSELKSVDIVDENHDFTKDTIEQNIQKLNTDFYIKIRVEKCASQSPDCFALSNGTYYKLNFDQLVTNETLVNGDFLKMGLTNANGLEEFNNRIIESLNTVLFAGARVKKTGLEEFKELIVKTLTQEQKSIQKRRDFIKDHIGKLTL